MKLQKKVENLELNGDEASICASSVSEDNESEMEIEFVFESGILRRKPENNNETADTYNISESDGDASKNKSSDNKDNSDSEIECIYESRISGSNTGNCIESKECTSSHKASNNTSQTAACISDQEEEKNRKETWVRL
ncbi:hypothetical protein CEXT_21281 [Caerostris extrusa]|uniref:Uncharacterized protein n=1 Tax=Caerostris extrusa TaxID=172846 RepID=A0AAV4QHZ5_CAEEX|nr:hypothetical protein CEXT_21281 [Caerostris extrusa]